MNFTDLQYSSSGDEDNQQASRVRRYQIPDFYFSFKKNVIINDEHDRGLYNFRTKSTFSSTLILEDPNGNGLITIVPDLMHIHSRYNIISARKDDHGRELAVIKQKSAFTMSKFDIDSVYGQYALDKVETLRQSFSIVKQGRPVASVIGNRFSKSCAIKAEISDEEDQAFILALILAIFDFLYKTMTPVIFF